MSWCLPPGKRGAKDFKDNRGMKFPGARVVLPLLVLVAVADDPSNLLTVCSSGCKYRSVQAAIDEAKPGDIVELKAGERFIEAVNIGEGKSRITLRHPGSRISLARASGFDRMKTRHCLRPSLRQPPSRPCRLARNKMLSWRMAWIWLPGASDLTTSRRTRRCTMGRLPLVMGARNIRRRYRRRW